MKTPDALLENLGNLEQLNLGPLVNVLRQTIRRSTRYGDEASPIGNKFPPSHSGPGNTSEITDIGVVKDGIKSIRKAYKAKPNSQGFALYLNNKAVLFAVANDYDIAGSSRTLKVAYDFTPWADKIEAIIKKDYRYNRPILSTFKTNVDKEREEYNFTTSAYNKIIEKHAGIVTNTGTLITIITILDSISKELGIPITAKLMSSDTAGQQRRINRYRLQPTQIRQGVNDLQTRLAVYKNSKRPSAATINDFIRLSLSKPGAIVQFAGSTYRLTPKESYTKIDPASILRGSTFKAEYESRDPLNSSGTVDLTYKYDRETNQLLPIFAEWYDRTDDNVRYNRQSMIVNTPVYLKHTFKIKTFDPSTVFPLLLSLYESGTADNIKKLKNILAALRADGIDWPELDTIESEL